jgi:hypothetical protein
VAVAAAESGGSSPNGTAAVAASAAGASGSATPAAGKHRAGVGRGVHGTFTAKDKAGQYVVHVYQRGTVTQSSTGQLTVRSADGAQWVWRIDPKTTVRTRAGASTALPAVGATVGIAGVRSGADNDAARVLVRPAATS